MVAAKRPIRWSASSWVSGGASLDWAGQSERSSHDWTHGRQPRPSDGKYTIPQRETVAGEATARSCTSNNMCILALSLMRSPLARQSVMLSSSTVFMFSIQSASTGPSKTIHWYSSFCVVSVTALRIMVEAMPSVHSCVSELTSPYSSPIVMHFGLKTYVLTGWKAASPVPRPCSSDMAEASVLMQAVLPPPVGPTVITPKRTLNVW
mmetsp:Transcript_2367/g.7841  ORF Transcript_2367/g.7841 Transcript_2367/m.7841 type:complete len:207 (-) Transcript_2367:5150-5770(-)